MKGNTGGRRIGVTLCVLIFVCSAEGRRGDPAPSTVDLEVFTRAGCPRCAAAAPFLEELQRQRPELRIRFRDVEQEPSALARLKELAGRQGIQVVGVPAFFLRGELIIGYLSAETTGKQIGSVLDEPLVKIEEEGRRGVCLPEAAPFCDPEVKGLSTDTETDEEILDTPLLGRLSVRAVGLPAFTVIVGLLDGFNPCAMWVLLFLLSLLVNLRDRAKMFVIGGAFVVVSGLVYFAFMAAWLNLFQLIGFSRAAQFVLGGVAALIGMVNIKDFFAFGRGVSLSIPEAAKPGIYARMRRVVQAENLVGALAGVIVLAVLVNMIELLCTAGLPAMYTRILTLRELPWWTYYGYLGLYNVAYMFDDSLMLLISVATLSRRKLQEREGRWLKLVSGVVMVGLGVVLIVNPGWLVG